MSTLFIAVQCFQCSTMQVKQQKRSSNKWVCVVCNEKQSIRKIHAQGYQAKHLRKFVQSFNSSRSDDAAWISPQLHRSNAGAEPHDDQGSTKKRTDWTEYLDAIQAEDDDGQEETERGVEGHLRVTTEIPPAKLGRAFPKCSSVCRVGERGNVSGALVPNFLKRKVQNENARQGNAGSEKWQKTGKMVQSKWSKYVEEEEEEIGAKDEPSDAREGLYRDLFVDEEVHPDFR